MKTSTLILYYVFWFVFWCFTSAAFYDFMSMILKDSGSLTEKKQQSNDIYKVDAVLYLGEDFLPKQAVIQVFLDQD